MTSAEEQSTDSAHNSSPAHNSSLPALSPLGNTAWEGKQFCCIHEKQTPLFSLRAPLQQQLGSSLSFHWQRCQPGTCSQCPECRAKRRGPEATSLGWGPAVLKPLSLCKEEENRRKRKHDPENRTTTTHRTKQPQLVLRQGNQGPERDVSSP